MTTVTIEGIEFPIKPTPAAKMVGALPLMLDGLTTEASVNALASALFCGIRRAGGEVTLEWLQDNLDVANIPAIFEVFCRVNSPEVSKAVAGAHVPP
ncbi:MAG: hypothetical protein ABI645_00530 [Pseudomonadota bacterium]